MFLAEQWRSQNKFPETKFIFPNAPQIAITVNMGMRMPGWYDITDIDAISSTSDAMNRSEDEPGILRSQSVFHNLIAEEIKAGIPSERIVLGGFSQGGAMSILSGVTCPTKLGGIFGLSCYMLLQGKLKDMVPASTPNQQTSIFMGHGTADPLIKVQWGEATAERLKTWGYSVDLKTYRGLQHSAAPEEINDLETWLRARIPDQGEK